MSDYLSHRAKGPLNQVDAVFAKADEDGNGVVDKEELRKYLQMVLVLHRSTYLMSCLVLSVCLCIHFQDS